MSILLLGKTGQLGTELNRTLTTLGSVTAVGRSDLCLTNSSELSNFLKEKKPKMIVNAAAYTHVDRAESEPDLAFQINAEAVAVLAAFAEKTGALLVHYSTDYVFDGVKQEAYLETDPTNPLNAYGFSKREGELAILRSRCKYLIFRTSWVYSVSGLNFIKTILKLAKDRSSLGIVSDQFGAPTSVELIGDSTLLAIDAYRKGQLKEGIYHLTASGVTNWYEFACYIVEKATSLGVPLQLKPEHIKPLSTEEYPLPAKRPKNSQLNLNLLSEQLNKKFPFWKEHVDKTVQELSMQELNA